MTGPCFVDANVFVYAGDPRDVAKQQRAIAWLDLLWRDRLGRTSTQALYESYVVLKRLATASGSTRDVWQGVKKYFVWSPLAIDETVLERAHEVEQRFRVSWWDAMIVAAAQLQDCSLLLSEDMQDTMTFGSVTVRNPFTMDLNEPVASYDVALRAPSPHRPRGRPRRTAFA